MKRNFALCILSAGLLSTSLSLVSAQDLKEKSIVLSPKAKEILSNKKILFIEREQYAPDHHNTETLFQKGEINEDSFRPGSAMRIWDVNTNEIKTLISLPDGVVRDPELSYDGTKVLFSMRKNKDDGFHIYEMNVDGSELKQLTKANDVSDIDPVYLPDGGIAFSSTRQPKYCMCNRHIMANLYRMNADGSNITQIGISTLFEGHASVLSDGRILYDRWEYVDRNFGDAQGLWTVNPDGTKHAVYYGNNTKSPGGVLDARQIPGTETVVCTFAPCHDRPWGAIAIVDRRKGVDGVEPVQQRWPAKSIDLVKEGDLDSFKWLDHYYEDPYPVNENNFLVS
ncbi:MAG: TolB family protein, partial [Tannerellaceae bacterium]